MPAPTPQELLTAIAADANPVNITSPMPVTPPVSPSNAACIEDGFPPITMQSELSGGLPPLGADMNGILFLITSHTLWVESGQLYPYSADIAAAIGGYAAGSILGMADGSGIWLCTLADNSSNPDAGGGGWVPLYSYGHSNIATTGGTITPTTSQLEKGVLVFTGTLATNLTVLLPQTERQYLIVNATSGAFNMTVKTAAVGSSGVSVPQGGFASPVGVYSVADGNIYPTVAPLSVPIDQSPTALSIVQRDNLGRVFATYFNGNTALETPTVGAVIVQNSAADGYFRKISLTNFEAQLLLQGLGGTLVNSQVPYSVVQQWAASLFSSAALTGTPTAPTAPLGTNNTQIATTAFVKALLGGSIFSFRSGTFNIVGNVAPGSVAFSSPFPTACLGVVCSVPSGGFQPGATGFTPSQFTPNGNACGTQLATYLAWGN